MFRVLNELIITKCLEWFLAQEALSKTLFGKKKGGREEDRMRMRIAFLHSFNKHEEFSGDNRKEKMLFQEENMLFQEHILGCADFLTRTKRMPAFRECQAN